MPDYFVSYAYEPKRWRHVPNTEADSDLWTATDANDACGLAALQNGTGKYVAFDVTDATTNQVQVQPSADLTSVPFSG